jgi:anti-anti-sigma regulatory factor
MKIERQGGTLRITGLRELGTANAHSFRQVVRAALARDLQTVEIDLSQTSFVDSCGLGADFSLQGNESK